MNNIIVNIYNKSLELSKHRLAAWYLGIMSFCESIFFPVPPDIMLMPMALSRPNNALKYAFITTISSVIGGSLGYSLGYLAFDAMHSWLLYLGYMDTYQQVLNSFATYGFWLILIAGFTPIPYKIFTIGAGALQYNFPLFIIGSIISRGARFYLVAGLIKAGGKSMENYIREKINLISLMMIVVLALVVVYQLI